MTLQAALTLFFQYEDKPYPVIDSVHTAESNASEKVCPSSEISKKKKLVQSHQQQRIRDLKLSSSANSVEINAVTFCSFFATLVFSIFQVAEPLER